MKKNIKSNIMISGVGFISAYISGYCVADTKDCKDDVCKQINTHSVNAQEEILFNVLKTQIRPKFFEKLDNVNVSNNSYN